MFLDDCIQFEHPDSGYLVTVPYVAAEYRGPEPEDVDVFFDSEKVEATVTRGSDSYFLIFDNETAPVGWSYGGRFNIYLDENGSTFAFSSITLCVPAHSPEDDT